MQKIGNFSVSVKFNLRKQTFFLFSLIATWGGEERQATVGNFKFWLFGDRNVKGDTGPLSALYTGFLGLDWDSYIQLTAVLCSDPDEVTGRVTVQLSLECQNPAQRGNAIGLYGYYW